LFKRDKLQSLDKTWKGWLEISENLARSENNFNDQNNYVERSN